MTITETIKQLEMIREMIGDVDVVAMEFQDDETVDAVEYEFHAVKLTNFEGVTEDVCVFLAPDELDYDPDQDYDTAPKKEPHLKIIR